MTVGPPQDWLDAVARTAAAPAPAQPAPLFQIDTSGVTYQRDQNVGYANMDIGTFTVPQGYANAGQQYNYSPGKTAADDPPFKPPVPSYNRAPAREALAALLRQFGLDGLITDIDQFIVDNGANDTFTLAERIRGSQPYKDRFKGLIALRDKGITDVRDEGEYLRLESEYRQAFRDAGLQSYIGEAGKQAERDAIADLVGKYSVSVNEVRNRINDAQRVVSRTDPETINALQRFYNVAPADLVAYTLDPQRTTSRINQLANAAILGGLAEQTGLQVGRAAAEQVADLSSDNDLSVEYARNQLTATRQVRDATARLASIEGSILTDDEALLAQSDIDQQAKKKIKGLQSRERARFGGTSAFQTSSFASPGA